MAGLEIAALREQYLRAELALPEDRLAEASRDEVDPLAEHFLAMFEGAIVAAARLSIHQHWDSTPDWEHVPTPTREEALRWRGPVASLNRLVVASEFRSSGLATVLREERLRVAREHGATVAAMVTRGSVLSSALRRGFFNVGKTWNAASHYLPGAEGNLVALQFDRKGST